jgi:hypothetical protein
MVGAYGPHAPQVIDDVLSDVTIFDPLRNKPLLTLSDPDQNLGSGFGRGLAPLGDVNNDGFIDLVVGAGGFGAGTCSPCQPTVSEPAQGRVYLFTSNNTPPPVTEPPVTEEPPTEPPTTPSGPAARTISLDVSRERVDGGGRVRLKGTLEAGDTTACEADQTVVLQRRAPRQRRFRRFDDATTGDNGRFSKRIEVEDTFVYRAKAPSSESCQEALSATERVKVVD